jgi:putative Mg2+ transporter-C (MgtC) family protein
MTLSNFFGAHELEFLIDLGLCLFSGILIGAERESRRKDAGISTHVLVIAGAMAFSFISSVADPASKSRIAANVITGIGFLGAGLIMKEGGTVKNLTTAASLWASAAIGMAYGFNFHVIGVLVTLLIVLTPRIPHVKRRTRNIPPEQ